MKLAEPLTYYRFFLDRVRAEHSALDEQMAFEDAFEEVRPEKHKIELVSQFDTEAGGSQVSATLYRDQRPNPEERASTVECEDARAEKELYEVLREILGGNLENFMSLLSKNWAVVVPEKIDYQGDCLDKPPVFST